jgi:valyl-tRNA synthetase
MMPFITEAVWQRLPWRDGGAPSLIVAGWPERVERWEDPGLEALVGDFQQVIGMVRNLRAEYGIQPSQRIELRITGATPELRNLIEAGRRILSSDLARVSDVTFERVPGEIGASAVLASGAEIFVPLGGVIDLDRERGRLRSEIERIGVQEESTRKRLANEAFVGRAPAEVVEREREKLASFALQRDKLSRSLAALEGNSKLP